MEQEFNCDFIFGDIEFGKIKEVDLNKFRKSVRKHHTIRIKGPINWISGTIKYVFKNYNHFIITGEPYCISSWLILVICKILNKKTYLWSHAYYGNETFFKRLLKNVYFGLGSKTLLYGNYAKQIMINNGFKRSKLEVIYNSLNYENQINIRRKLHQTDVYQIIFRNDNLTFVFTGRLTKVKKLDYLFKAVNILKKQGIYVNVLLLGDGDQKDYLQELGSMLNISDQIHFYGSCYDEEKIAEFYFNAAACVSPGNVGLTGIHAMTYGCPVISHNNFKEQMPEFEIISEGVTGFFFDQNNVISLADVMKKVVNNSNKMRESCFKVIDEKFNTRYQIKQFKEILKNS